MSDGREDRPALDRWFERVFDDDESSRLGSGWLSGTASVFLGALGPLHLAGFAEPALYAYLVFVSFHAVFIHAKVRLSFGALESLLVTPRFHHWHHARAAEARDRNFAVHLPWLDRLFGTTHLPRGEWPDGYGITGDPVPEGYLGQLAHPFRLDPTAP